MCINNIRTSLGDDNTEDFINAVSFVSDSNPFDSDDDIPLAETSIKKIRQFEKQKAKETENNIHKLRCQQTKDESVDLDSVRDDYTFKCTICDKEYKHSGGLRNHTATHFEKETYQCPYCSVTFNGKKNVPHHVKQFHFNEYKNFNIRQLKRLNPDNTPLNSSALKHELSKEDVEMKSLDEPEIVIEQLRNDESFDSHNSAIEPDSENAPSEDEVALFKCTLCDKKYKYGNGLKQHMKFVHIEPTIVKCPYCEREFQGYKNLPRHIKKLHPKEYDANYRKTDLNKVVPLLENGISMFSGDGENDDDSLPTYQVYDVIISKWQRELECDLCKKKFINYNLLWLHFKDEHPSDNCHVVCCGHKILTRKLLVEHIRFHLNPNSFKCEVCGKPFRDSQRLKHHFRVMHKEKKFECQVCQKRFHIKSFLLYHMGIHSTEKNYFCKICNEGFATEVLKKKHEHNSHKKMNARNLCDQCGKSCSTAKILKEHLLEHANVEKKLCII